MSKKSLPFLVDFGLSQEDPLTEQYVLDIQPGDKILSLASAGDVPLSLASLNKKVNITAVDISEAQVRLCRLKLLTALRLGFPLNGQFLGFMDMDKKIRREIFNDLIRPHLSPGEVTFWDRNMLFIEKGVINSGRFERYIGKMRLAAKIFIGKRNLDNLITCQTIEGQNKIFNTDIATRKSLQLLFRVAFHPAVYRKRGLREQALIHADKTTGERFYSKFRDFCTVNPASENYFLQYFLTGRCHSGDAFPHYLRPDYKCRLTENSGTPEFLNMSLQDALSQREKGSFNKIHLSNLGDWLTADEFANVLSMLKQYCNPGTIVCYRYLQKNHFGNHGRNGFSINKIMSEEAERKDRFPFYSILKITLE